MENYIWLIQKTIDYIDENITEKITVDELAKMTGFSTYHFYRVFNSFVGLPVMEYLMRRKLRFALYELYTGKRIIDIAMDYGFETHAGFNKAFKRCFGFSPSIYRLHAPVSPPQKVDLLKLKTNKIGGVDMQPKIIEKEAFKIAGYEFKTTLRNNAHTRDIPVFWDDCGIEGKGYENKLYYTLTPPFHAEYGICAKLDMETDEFSYIFGVYAENFDKAATDMVKLEIPAATYAVFTSQPVDKKDFIESIKSTWKYIFEEWFPNSGYEVDDDKVDFEYYDERRHPWIFEKISMDIYVPIKKKNTLSLYFKLDYKILTLIKICKQN